jgi:hypothetical protein
MRHEIEQRDHLSVASRDTSARWKQVGKRIGKLDLAAPHHIGQQDPCEHLRHGTDLEHTLSIQRARIGARIAISKHAPRASFIKQSNDDASDSVAVDKLLEHGLDRCVRGQPRLRRR